MVLAEEVRHVVLDLPVAVAREQVGLLGVVGTRGANGKDIFFVSEDFNEHVRCEAKDALKHERSVGVGAACERLLLRGKQADHHLEVGGSLLAVLLGRLPCLVKVIADLAGHLL